MRRLLLLLLFIAAPLAAQTVHFDFETGDLQGWKVVEGEFEKPVVDLVSPYRTGERINKQGRYFLSTLGATAATAADKHTGVIESPVFELAGTKMSFLVGGGKGDKTRVELCEAESGRALLSAGGPNTKYMRRVNWNVGKLKGRKLFVRVVDESTGGFGHVTFDDFSTEGKIDAKATTRRPKE